MKIQKFLAGFVCLALLSASSSTFASYTCSGQVRGVSIDTGGDVLVESVGSLSWPRLCNIRATANGVPSDVCKPIYASLLAAQATGKSVTF